MPRARSPIDSFHTRRSSPHSASAMAYETSTTTRSPSPLHFLNPAAMVYGASTSTGAGKTSSSKRRHSADVSRLLDPSYLPSTAKAARSASVSVYIDPHGDLHDPDYRHFPVASPSHSSHSHHSAHHAGQHHGYTYSYQHGTRRTTSPRPHFDWELAVDESALDDEYPEDEEDLLMHGHQQYQYQQSRRAAMNTRRPRESSVSTTATMRTGAAYSYYSPTGTASTLPTSCEDEVSPFEAEKESEKEKEKEKEKDKKRRRLSKGDKEKEKERLKEAARMRDAEKAFIRRVSFDEDPAPLAHDDDTHTREDQREDDERANDEEEEEDAEARRVLREQGEYVPSCTQSLRREWQAFALRVRFGVFRARRRVARKMQALF